MSLLGAFHVKSDDLATSTQTPSRGKYREGEDGGGGDYGGGDYGGGDYGGGDAGGGDAGGGDSGGGDYGGGDYAAESSEQASSDDAYQDPGNDMPSTAEAADANQNEADFPDLQDPGAGYGSDADVGPELPLEGEPPEYNPNDITMGSFGDQAMAQATAESTEAPADPQPSTQVFDDGSELHDDGNGNLTATEAPADPPREVTDADVAAALAAAANDPSNPVVSENDPSIWELAQSGAVPYLENVLAPRDHGALSNQAARDVGFSPQAAQAFAMATVAVDFTQFNNEGAHATAAPGQTPMDAAQTAIDRATALGDQLATQLDNFAADPTPQNAAAIVQTVGQMNHLLQDSYAHQGMTLNQHAWLDSNGQSPDRPPNNAQALADAGIATNQIMGNLAQAMLDRGIDPATFAPPNPSGIATLGGAASQFGGMAGYYFNNGSGWNGVDTRWPAGTNVLIQHGFQNGLGRR